MAAGHVPASLLSGLAALAGRGAAGTGVCVHVCNTDVSPGELEAGDVEEKRRQTSPRPRGSFPGGRGRASGQEARGQATAGLASQGGTVKG